MRSEGLSETYTSSEADRDRLGGAAAIPEDRVRSSRRYFDVTRYENSISALLVPTSFPPETDERARLATWTDESGLVLLHGLPAVP